MPLESIQLSSIESMDEIVLFCKIVYLVVLSHWPDRLRSHGSRGVVTRQIVVLLTKWHLPARGEVGYSQSRSSPHVLGQRHSERQWLEV